MDDTPRPVVVHVMAGTSRSFEPRSPVIPEIRLKPKPEPLVPLDRVFPNGCWGGWPLLLFERLGAEDSETTHLVGGILLEPETMPPSEIGAAFIHRLKRLLIVARRTLMEMGFREIRTGVLMAEAACLDWYRPEEEVEGSKLKDRLFTLGFVRRLQVTEEGHSGSCEPPFHSITFPSFSSPEAGLKRLEGMIRSEFPRAGW